MLVHTFDEAVARLNQERADRHAVFQYYAGQPLPTNPQEASYELASRVDQHLLPQHAVFWARHGQHHPVWIIAHGFEGDRLWFNYASEYDRDLNLLPPKAGTGNRARHDIFIGEEAGNIAPPAALEIAFWLRFLSENLHPVAFQITAVNTPGGLGPDSRGKNQRRWLQAYCVTPSTAIACAKQEYQTGAQSRVNAKENQQ